MTLEQLGQIVNDLFTAQVFDPSQPTATELTSFLDYCEGSFHEMVLEKCNMHCFQTPACKVLRLCLHVCAQHHVIHMAPSRDVHHYIIYV